MVSEETVFCLFAQELGPTLRRRFPLMEEMDCFIRSYWDRRSWREKARFQRRVLLAAGWRVIEVRPLESETARSQFLSPGGRRFESFQAILATPAGEQGPRPRPHLATPGNRLKSHKEEPLRKLAIRNRFADKHAIALAAARAARTSKDTHKVGLLTTVASAICLFWEGFLQSLCRESSQDLEEVYSAWGVFLH
jgi:hypothetical protein